MKKNLLYALATSLVLSGSAYAQTTVPCAPKGIVTDPATAVNNENPLKRNTFNWSANQYTLNWDNNAWTSLLSPYNDVNNANVNHLYLTPDLAADGWELINRDLGYDDQGNKTTTLGNPYVIIYNKHTGVLRVFVAVGRRQADYQYAKIRMYFNAATGNRSALLSNTENIVQPLNSLKPGLEFHAVSLFINETGRWFMADFPMTYDPCTCLYQSGLRFDVNLISQAAVSLKGIYEGSMESKVLDVANGSGTLNNGGGSKQLSIANVGAAFKGGVNTYNTINGFYNDQMKAINKQTEKTGNQNDANNKAASLNLLQAALKSSGFLKEGLKQLPWVGMAVSIADYFIGGGKNPATPQEVRMQPMTIQMHSTMTGTITADAVYKTIFMNTPGALYSSPAGDKYPYYNEVMGVFNLLEKPVVYRKTSYATTPDRNRQTTIQYRIPNDIKYVINPAAKLAIQDMQLALVVNGTSYEAGGPGGGEFSNYEGIRANVSSTTSTTLHSYRSEYTDVECINATTFSIYASSEPGNINWLPSGDVYLKVMLNLKRTDGTGQNVLYVVTYPVSVTSVSDVGTGVCHPVPPQSNVSAFCNSSTYQTLIRIKADKKDDHSDESSVNEPAFVTGLGNAYPNPTSGKATIEYTLAESGKATITITNELGQVVREINHDHAQSIGVFEADIDISDLKQGVYFYTIQTGNHRETKKLVLIK